MDGLLDGVVVLDLTRVLAEYGPARDRKSVV